MRAMRNFGSGGSWDRYNFKRRAQPRTQQAGKEPGLRAWTAEDSEN